jgi:hypothetical protein
MMSPHPKCLALFADDTYMYVMDRKEAYVLRKLQHGTKPVESWCECLNIKINKDKIHAIYIAHRHRTVEAQRTLNERNVPSENQVIYHSVIFVKI